MIATIPARRLEIHRDDRGNVRETYRASWFPDVPPIVQLVRSESSPFTLRGMHVHREQWDVWTFMSGSAVVRLDDEYLLAGTGQTIVIPPGTAHGFYTAPGCILLYGLTREYDGTDEYGWYPLDGADPEWWPVRPEGLHISDRDLGASPR